MFAIFSIGLLLFVVHKIWNLLRNIAAAKTTGLPYIFTLALETEILGQILDPLL